MKKTFKLKGLDCANCALKMEKAISKIDGVESVSVNFITAKLIMEVNEEAFDNILLAAQKAVKKIESGCQILNT